FFGDYDYGALVLFTKSNPASKLHPMKNRYQKGFGVTTSLIFVLAAAPFVSDAWGDETCSSPYLARIEGQEEFIYVWTLGVEGLGDGSDKLVTVDVKPGSPNYGKVI